MKLHPKFKLDNVSLDKNELLSLAQKWVKLGLAHEKEVGRFFLEWFSEGKRICVQTSGSTGSPKKVALEKEFMINSALATGKYFQLQPGNSALLCLSSQHIAGKMMLVRAMVLGLELDVVAPNAFPLQGKNTSFDFVAMVPLQVQNSIDQLEQINHLIIGGAPVSKSLRSILSNKLNRIYETYGMTETITHIAVKRITNISESYQNYFEVLPGVQIQKDERDCLVIKAPHISKETISTNDIVEIKDEHYFKWIGRFDTIINSGGIKLVPEQIEEKLSSHLNSRFFITGLPDEEFGEKVVLFIEGNGQQPEEIREQLLMIDSLHKYEVPKDIFYIKNFVETASGKINRLQTKIQFLNP